MLHKDFTHTFAKEKFQNIDDGEHFLFVSSPIILYYIYTTPPYMGPPCKELSQGF